MATSSFSRHFVINDPKEVEKLIQAMENPLKIKLEKSDPVKKEQKKEMLCAMKKRLGLMS